MNWRWFIGCICVFLAACSTEKGKKVAVLMQEAVVIIEPVMKYGFDLNQFHLVEGEISPGDVLSKVLVPLGVSLGDLEVLINDGREIFDVRKIRPNHKWTTLFETDSAASPSFFVYERSVKDFVVFSLKDSLAIWNGSHPVTYEMQKSTGIIMNSLYQTLDDAGAPTTLALDMNNIFAWTIDFYRLQKGDAFEVLYEQELVDGAATGAQNILAVNFTHKDRERKAYYFNNDSIAAYFDDKGESLRKAFLKAPVKYSRISSKFTGKRFHPVLKRYKSHLGTDYAAPTGTPIFAVGDGVISKSAYTSGNGNYVKIRHNGTYETQYLHMSKRAAKVGQSVQQGDVIGYVGSTGLATGPHVCFRFWKNGKQVDHLKEDFPPSEPIGANELINFNEAIVTFDSLMQSTPATNYEASDSPAL